MKDTDHIERHKVLHSCFDELLGDFISRTSKMPSETTIWELLTWSHKECLHPSDDEGKEINNIHDK